MTALMQSPIIMQYGGLLCSPYFICSSIEFIISKLGFAFYSNI